MSPKKAHARQFTLTVAADLPAGHSVIAMSARAAKLAIIICVPTGPVSWAAIAGLAPFCSGGSSPKMLSVVNMR